MKQHTIINKAYKTIGGTLLLIALFLGNVTQAVSQDIVPKVKLDTNAMLIGDQINLKLSVQQPKDIRIAFPVLSDTIVRGVEIIKQNPLDTLQLKNGNIKIDKNITITAFDTGNYAIKPFQFTIIGKDGTKQIITNSLQLRVNTVKVDTTKAHRDIIMPIDTPLSFAEIAPWLLGGLLLLIVIGVLVWFFRFRNSEHSLFAVTKPKEPAHVIALRKLDTVKKEKLWQIGKTKQFYSDITDTLRIYLDERYNLSTQESTTSEILQEVAGIEISETNRQQLREILERADLAKFAKFTPLPNENDQSLQYAYQIVESTIITETENNENTEAEASEQNKNE